MKRIAGAVRVGGAGWGHNQIQCPSEARIKRPINACIQGLQSIKDAESSRANAGGKGRGPRVFRRPGSSPGRPAARPKAHALASIPDLIEYDDGGIYTSSGEEVRAPIDPAPPDEAPPIEAVPVANPASMTAVATATPADAPDSLVTNGGGDVQGEGAFPSTLEDSLSSTVYMQMAESAPDIGNYDEFVRSQRNISYSKIALGAAVALVGALGAAALSARSGRGRTLLTFLALVGGGQCASTRTTTFVHSSDFSRSNKFSAYEFASAPKNTPTTNIHRREHGTVDSGTTECASGRRKLFPDSMIEQWNPNIKVEIASGVTLSVLLKGAMLMKFTSYGTTSTKKFTLVPCPHSLHVPLMPVTLISPKALLNYCGIRTYFNDELCFIMPDGTLVEFFESSTSFMVPFADDTDPITIARRANKSKWPWAQDTCDTLRLTLQQPLPITWDLLHDRLCHYGPDKIYDSREFICGIDTTLLSSPSRNRKICVDCVHGSFRGHRHKSRPPGVYIRFGQRIYSDSCVMPKSMLE